MKPLTILRVAILVFTVKGSAASAQGATNELRASVAVASDFVQYGLLQNNSSPSLRIAFDYEHRSGFFVGGTLASVDYKADARFRNPRDIQATIYSGYVWHRGSWRANVAISQYEYPDFERNFDYAQASASIAYRDRYFLTLTTSGDYLDIYDRSEQVDAGIALPWISNLEFSASAGRVSYGGPFAASFNYWDIGLSRPFGRFSIDLRFHDNSFNRNIIAGNVTHNQWVVSTTYALLPFRRLRDRR